jgi:CHAT domain-containing protein
MGFARDALADLDNCRRLVQVERDPKLFGTISTLSSRAYVSLGERERAETLLEETIGSARARGDADLAAAAQIELGVLFTAEQRWSEGEKAFRNALAVAAEFGDHQLAATAAINAASAILAGSPTGYLSDVLDQAQEHIEAVEPGRTRMDILLALSDARLKSWREPSLSRAPSPRKVAQVYENLKEAAAWAQEAGDVRTESLAIGYLGRLYQRQGETTQALALAREALRLAEIAAESSLVYQWDWQIAQLLNALGRTDEAVVAYQSTVENMRAVRPDLYSASLGSGGGFRAVIGPIYQEYAALLLQHATDLKGAQLQRDLAAARQVIEEFKVAELEDYFGDECVAALGAKTQDIDALTQTAAVLYPIVLQDRLELLLTVKGHIRRLTVPVSADELTKEILAFRQRLERVTTNQYLPHAQRLYNWILRPLEDDLHQAGIHTLVIVPDGPLRTVPLAALHDGVRFAAEKYQTAVVPGLSLLDVQPVTKVSEKKVLLGAVTEPVDGFSALPAASDEVATIRELFPTLVLENQAFSATAMEKALATTAYPIVHIASHGVVAIDPRQSYVLAFDGKLSLDRLEGLLKKSEFRSQPVELLTLSACSTATGDDRAALGLAGMGIKAGARSVVASLWYVNDVASAKLIGRFYHALAEPDMTKAEALQRAQLAMLDDPRFRHPGFWSPFILIGNWF